jgi:hypothetical protein
VLQTAPHKYKSQQPLPPPPPSISSLSLQQPSTIEQEEEDRRRSVEILQERFAITTKLSDHSENK